MSKNIYTNAVDNIKAPQKAVDKMLETVRNYNKKEKILDMKKFRIKGAIAASLAAIVAIGGAIGIGSFSNRTDNSFILSVNAAEITDKNSATVSISGDHGFSYSEGDNDEVGYSLGLPVSCKGDNIDTITYSVDNGAISVNYYKKNNPVVSGKLNNKCNNTPETVAYTKADQNYLNKQSENIRKKHKGENPVTVSGDEYDPAVNYRTKHYSSITLKYNNQLPDGCDISLVGDSTNLSKENQSYLKAHKDELFNLDGKDTLLNDQKTCIDKLLNDKAIHCTVKFKDGSTKSEDIKLGTTIAKSSEVNTKAFKEIPKRYRNAKDYKDVFVTYTLA